ncbi:MAG: DNA-directed RNA polymerase subunit D [Candidatus Aenigmarchaeota archaeon]|nr:DNA-directed RNA polymerase subunit D [Candidatus Aenigmarchaeota archaeon]
MKIQILSKTDSEISFLVEGINAEFANALRRIMMSEIPTMAIEWVDFKKNDSALTDEVLANRLGQIPLTFDKRAYNLPEECKCGGKGCKRCQTELVLKKKGPCRVYSGDLRSRDRDVMPVFDKIPIVDLFEEQELELEAIAQLGIGRTHAKWQAVVVGYKNLPNIIINSKKCKGETCKQCVERCVKKVLKIEKGRIVIKDPTECSLCMQCVDICPEEAIKVEDVEDCFIFNVEKASGLSPEEVVLQASEVLEEKLNEFNKNLRKLK